MILYANGCSWTAGLELEYEEELFNEWLKTQPEQYNMYDFYNQYNWPTYLGKQLDADTVINDAVGGGSNQRMIRTTLNYINSLTEEQRKDVIVVLCWTSAERNEIYIDDPVIKGWQVFNLTQPFGDFILSEFKDRAKGTIKRVEELQKYYLAAGHSLVGCVETYLNQQFMMKCTLEQLGIKYLFFQSVPAWWDTWLEENVYEKYATQLALTEHPANIGIYFNDAMQTVCNVQGFQHAPAMHVLREGHEYWAKEVLYPRLMELYGE